MMKQRSACRFDCAKAMQAQAKLDIGCEDMRWHQKSAPQPPHPLCLSSALPTELLWHIIHHCTFPTTLIICSSRADFLTSLTHQVIQETAAGPTTHDSAQDELNPTTTTPTTTQAAQLLAAPLYQVAVARHIRLVFIPTVSHLRAFLSVFSVDESRVPAPPAAASELRGSNGTTTAPPKTPLLFIYGFLDLHRDTSEWSVQGLGNTAAVLVEAAMRVGFQPAILEVRTREGGAAGLDELLAERLPVLSGSVRRTGPDLAGGGWTGRTVDVKRVLARWFRFQPGNWDQDNGNSLG
ncbi:hypothetical protein B0H67DRAFT_580816 [Lasiosphaeris hirsuta]|uniref:Uncharacterized protein n=1 Tax=Lasiosphaeris hirsuta TaxID=260670 RepID=A0AA40AGQ4_9PEZI|nr:hypothetical protein B0H67DRAFT_580816 [Lasiosphaeris hirsuta]